MARWQILKAPEGSTELEATGEEFDDGLDLHPGDDGFSNEVAVAHAAESGAVASYMGPSH